MALWKYRAEFGNLNPNKRGRMTAPHKAVLLLAVIELVEEGVVDSRFVPISGVVLRRFMAVWERMVGEHAHYRPAFYYPFFHLGSSSFWTLVKSPDYVERGEYGSMPQLRESFVGAWLAEDLWRELLRADSREVLRKVLIESYLRDGDRSRGFGGRIALGILLGVLAI